MEIFHIVIIGIVSCLAMDMWQRLLKLLYDINPSDWGVVGRWFLLVVSRGKIYNPTIDEETPIKNELMIGWIVHYSVAILYSVFFFILLVFLEDGSNPFYIAKRIGLKGKEFNIIKIIS